MKKYELGRKEGPGVGMHSDPRRWRVFVVTYWVYVVAYLTRKSFSVVKILVQRDLDISTYALGAIDSAFLGTYSVFQLILPVLSDHTGVRPILLGALVAMAFFSFLFGVGQKTDILTLAWLCEGLAHAPVFSVLIKATSLWFSPHERVRVLGVWTTSQQVGGMAATLLASYAAELSGSWRAAFIAPAIVTAGTAIIVCIALPEPPPPVLSDGSALSTVNNDIPPNIEHGLVAKDSQASTEESGILSDITVASESKQGVEALSFAEDRRNNQGIEISSGAVDSVSPTTHSTSLRAQTGPSAAEAPTSGGDSSEGGSRSRHRRRRSLVKDATCGGRRASLTDTMGQALLQLGDKLSSSHSDELMTAATSTTILNPDPMAPTYGPALTLHPKGDETTDPSTSDLATRGRTGRSSSPSAQAALCRQFSLRKKGDRILKGGRSALKRESLSGGELESRDDSTSIVKRLKTNGQLKRKEGSFMISDHGGDGGGDIALQSVSPTASTAAAAPSRGDHGGDCLLPCAGGGGAGGAVSAGDASGFRPMSLWEVLFVPHLLSCALAYFCVKVVRYALLFWLPFFLTVRLGFATAPAGYASMLFDLGGVFGSLASGFLSDRLFRGRKFTTAVTLCLATALSLLLMAALTASAGTLAAPGLLDVPPPITRGAPTQPPPPLPQQWGGPGVGLPYVTARQWKAHVETEEQDPERIYGGQIAREEGRAAEEEQRGRGHLATLLDLESDDQRGESHARSRTTIDGSSLSQRRRGDSGVEVEGNPTGHHHQSPGFLVLSERVRPMRHLASLKGGRTDSFSAGKPSSTKETPQSSSSSSSLTRSQYWTVLLLITSSGFAIAGPDSILGAAAAGEVCERCPNRRARLSLSTATGLVNGLGSMGGVAQSYVTAAISEQFGWPVFFVILGICSAGTGLCLARLLVVEWRSKGAASYAPLPRTDPVSASSTHLGSRSARRISKKTAPAPVIADDIDQ